MNLPFTYPSIVRNHLGNSKTLLDVGCGNGSFMRAINFDKKYSVTGIDLFDPYLKQAKKTGLYKTLIKRNLKYMTFPPKEFDAVLANQVVEHFNKKDATELIKKIEKFSCGSIVIGTPNGHYHQEEYDHNVLQKHLSAWKKKDFERLGYRVYGQGLKIVYGEQGLMNKQNSLYIRYSLLIISYLFSPITYLFPTIAAYLIAVKKR